MKIYIAGAFSRRRELAKVAEEIERDGHVVTSRWLMGIEEHSHRERALIDLADCRRADVIVRFTDNLNKRTVSSKLISGARHFEAGFMFGTGKPVIVVGGHQNVFDYLPGIVHLADKDQLINYLRS